MAQKATLPTMGSHCLVNDVSDPHAWEVPEPSLVSPCGLAPLRWPFTGLGHTMSSDPSQDSYNSKGVTVVGGGR